MNLSPRSRVALDFATVAGRWFVGAAFIYMGVLKLLDPVQFLKMVRQYEMVNQPWLLNSIAAALPWFEVFCGTLLVLGIAVRGTALNLILMLVPFTLMVLKRALAVAAAQKLPFCAVSFDCGCGTGEVLICQKLVENSALTFLCCWMLAGRGRQLCARYSLVSPVPRNQVPVPTPSTPVSVPDKSGQPERA